MKTTLRHFCALFILAFCCNHIQPVLAAADQDRSQLTIELRDGSHLIGRDLGQTLNFHSTALGNFQLTWAGIRSIEYVTANTDMAQLTTTNSDVFAVEFMNSTVRVETDFGTNEFSAKLIRSIKVLWKSKIQLPAGLVSLWSGESNAVDSVSGNNGKLQGNVTYANGRIGQAFVFDGERKSFVNIGNATNLQLQDFTIVAWIKRDNTSSVSASYRIGMIFGHGIGGYGLYFNREGNPVLTKLWGSATSPKTAIKDTNWHHLAVTKAGTNVVFYVDGVAYPAPAFDREFVFSTGAAIGSNGDKPGNSFLGLVDEVGIYNRALSASEIQIIYADQNSAPLQPASKNAGSGTTIDGTFHYEIHSSDH